MRHSRLALLVLMLLFLAASCSDGGLPTGPMGTDEVVHAISDGAHDGTDGFYFLPPMVGNPAYSGTFDGSLSPVVEICETPACSGIHASFSMTDGTGSELVRVDPDAEHYKVNWHTDQTGAVIGQTYRVRVNVAGTVLGYADVHMAENGKEARNTTTGDVIGLVDGRTLPVTFRIEVGAGDQDAGFVVGSEGGTFATSDGKVILDVPQGAVDSEIEITITSVNDNLNDPDVVPDMVFDFLPSPHTFIVPVTVTFTFDPDNLPSGVATEELRILGVVDGEWVQLPGSSVDLASSTVSGPLDGFSRKAVGRGKVHAIAVTPEDPFIGVDDTQQFEATVTNVDGEEMDRTVQWSSPDDAVATIDNNGLATGVALGQATIEARVGSVRGYADLTVGLAAPVVTTITVSPANAIIEEGSTVQFTASVFDQYEAIMDGQTVEWTSTDATVASVSSSGVATGVSTGGVTIVAGIGEIGGSAGLTVREVGSGLGTVDRITVTPSSAAVEEGGTRQFEATVFDVNDAIVYGEIVAWTSADEIIATVSTSGMATGVSVGVTTITATIDEISGDALLTVQAVSDVEILAETITGGQSHSCGLTETGDAYCWGRNNHGQLGNGTTTTSHRPVRVEAPAGVTFASISAGFDHTMALVSTGDAYGWGDNTLGQLGNGTSTSSNRPIAVDMPAGVIFTQIRAGYAHSVALTATGVAYAWGRNYFGQLGDGTTTDSDTPVPVTMREGVLFVTISAGTAHNLALTATGDIYGWGRNNFYQISGGSSGAPYLTMAKVFVPTGVTIAAVSAGQDHSLALSTTGVAYGWGGNTYGQAGNGCWCSSPREVTMPEGISFSAISAGGVHSLALSTAGDAYGWGHNAWGEIGDGTTSQRNAPTAAVMPTEIRFSAISGGKDRHSLAITSTGSAYAWGRNQYGQLGDGTTTTRLTPVQVIGGVIFDQ
jgi:alpha-tubulin suppressor-like RCC1 family protein